MVENWEYIDFDLENIPLEIRTDSFEGSEEKVRIGFRGNMGTGDQAGYLIFHFMSPPKYLIGYCTLQSSLREFKTTLPTEISKIWRITLSRTSENKLVVVQCNGVEVLNFEVSKTNCADTRWNKFWNKDVSKIYFHQNNTASDQFRSVRGWFAGI